jgi:hypothetical protein
MAKQPEPKSDPAPATFDVLFEFDVCNACEEAGRKDMTLTFSVAKVTGDTSLGFYDNRSRYENMPPEGEATIRAILKETSKRIKAQGIKGSWLGWFKGHFVATGLSWDKMKSVQELGLQTIRQLDDLGYQHAEAKGVDLPEAKELRDKRRR